MPPRREPDDEQAGVAARLEHAVLARRRQQRLGRDAQDALDGERAVREQAARVALALLRHGGGAREPERRTVRRARATRRARPPPSRARPLRTGRARALGRRVPRNEQRHVARRLLEDGGELLVGSSLGQELVGGVGEQELDVELGREPSQLLARRRRRERGRAGGDTARLECRPALFEPGRRGPELGCVRHQPGEDHDARRVSREPLGHREQRVDARLVRDRDEDRPLRNLADTRRLARSRSSAGSCRRIARSSSCSAGLGSIPSSVDEGPARVLVGVQGLRLPARAIQRRHQLSPQTLAERVLGDEGLELSDQLVVAPEREVGVDPQLDCCQPDLARAERSPPGRSSRRRSPRAPGLATATARRGAAADASAARPRASKLLPSSTSRSNRWRSSASGLDPNDVAGRSGRQHVLRQRLAKSRDVDPQCGGGALGRVLAPELVDQPVGRNDLVGVEEEEGEQGPRLAAAQRRGAAFVPQLERSQDPELHLPASRPGTLTGCCQA